MYDKQKIFEQAKEAITKIPMPDIPADFNELDNSFNFEFNADDFSFETDLDIETRIIKPPQSRDKTALWKNAQKTAKQIEVKPGMSYFGIIDGSFIFGDLIEAILVGQHLKAERMDISTLSLSQENIDSLATLMIKGYIGELNLIISDYFYVHEKKLLIPYIYQELDIDNRFQLISVGTHCKIVTANLSNGVKLVIDGSANLRSSGNIEQIRVQDNEFVYNFVTGINDSLIEKFRTINKSIRRNKLWQRIAAPGKAVNQ